MRKTNCWEFFNCGRQLGGHKENDLGACKASLATRFNKVNEGVNGGRFCWNIVDTLCKFRSNIQHTSKRDICNNCDFKKLVLAEEENCFIE